MATYQLPPPPPLPQALNFGSDPRPGFSEPTRYGVSNPSRRVEAQRQSFDEPRMDYLTQHGQLPSVSQLLTPGSHSSGTSSPFSPQQLPVASENRSAHPSPARLSGAEQPAHTAEVSYQGRPAQLPLQPQFQETMGARREAIAPASMSLQYPVVYPQDHDLSASRYPNHPTVAHPPAPPLQPPSISPISPTHYHQIPSSGYAYNPVSSPMAAQARQDALQAVKPVPRVVGEQDVPGEGPCWIYEDGSICRKIIDGQPVNAQWGVTKAGKPRKRLAIACTTCREKKIKCDPGEGKCLQCEKFGRDCRFTTA